MRRWAPWPGRTRRRRGGPPPRRWGCLVSRGSRGRRQLRWMPCGQPSGVRGGPSAVVGGWERHAHRRAATTLVGDRRRGAAVPLRDPLDDRQPEPGAAVALAVHAVEGVEDPRVLVDGDADAVVDD